MNGLRVAALQVHEVTDAHFRVTVFRTCGHTYAGTIGWLTADAAKTHGENLLACACSTCRNQDGS